MLVQFLAILASLHATLAQFDLNLDKLDYDVTDSIVLSWDTTNSAADLSSQNNGVVSLCTCNSTTAFNCVQVKKGIPILTQTSVSLPVSDMASIGSDGMYMMQFVSTSSTSKEYTIAYTHDWFNLTGMTGTQKTGDSCSVPYGLLYNFPNTQSSISWPSYTIPTQYQGISSNSIPFTWQLGPTRYAPSQGTPGTKITATSTPSRRQPTSSVSSPFTSYFFNSLLPLTTITPSGSPFTQWANFAATISTTPAGYDPSAAKPTYDPSAISPSKHRRRRRWANY